MVAIRIQSSEDIIKAYFRNLGFRGKELGKVCEDTAGRWNENASGKEDILTFLDGIIVEKAQTVFSSNDKLGKSQIAAKFKMGFLLSTKKSRFEDFINNDLKEDFLEAENNKIFATAPEYKPKEMKAQKIESPETSGWLNKIFHWGK